MSIIHTKEENLYKTDRLLAFSDGVLAIAITLLILEIKIPKHEELIAAGGLYKYLTQIWPSYLAYIMSFIFIGIYWSNHHWLFSFIKKTNHTFNLLNILFLMGICFMPFTTAIMGEYFMDPEYSKASVSAYCIGFIIPLPPLIALVLYAFHKSRLVEPTLSKSFRNSFVMKLFSGFGFNLIGIGLSFSYPIISICFVVLQLFMYLLPPAKPTYEEIAN